MTSNPIFFIPKSYFKFNWNVKGLRRPFEKIKGLEK